MLIRAEHDTPENEETQEALIEEDFDANHPVRYEHWTRHDNFHVSKWTCSTLVEQQFFNTRDRMQHECHELKDLIASFESSDLQRQEIG